ncbi:MAG: hypothetical protein QOG35_2039 [Solirubrobacteraceae bacterium]|jgi:hypothetical protein|nr:hypothetical protein [Solirubrobacteraceae bacterium]
MTGSLPGQVLEVFERWVAAEYVTVGDDGQPHSWPAEPSFDATDGCIDVSTEVGLAEAAANPHVALLFSDPERAEPHMVLVQGTAKVREGGVRVRPERVLTWPDADLDAEPRLYDARLEEVRSGHNQEPEVGHAPPSGGGEAWDAMLDAMPATAGLSFVGPDGFPFAVRVPVRADHDAGVVRIDADPVGAPIEPGLGCLCTGSLQVCGDLVEDHGGWILRPHATAEVGGAGAGDRAG